MKVAVHVQNDFSARILKLPMSFSCKQNAKRAGFSKIVEGEYLKMWTKDLISLYFPKSSLIPSLTV